MFCHKLGSPRRVDGRGVKRTGVSRKNSTDYSTDLTLKAPGRPYKTHHGHCYIGLRPTMRQKSFCWVHVQDSKSLTMQQRMRYTVQTEQEARHQQREALVIYRNAHKARD